MTDFWQTVRSTLYLLSFSFVEKRTHTRRFNARCPSKTDVLSGPKFRTSICPTYRVTDVDVNRIPQTIVQRRCKCTECLSVLDSTLGPRAFSRCVPTFQYQMVLRRVGCASGVFEYKPVMEPFVVGCSCKLFFDQWMISEWMHPRFRAIHQLCMCLLAGLFNNKVFLYINSYCFTFYIHVCILDQKKSCKQYIS